MDAPPGRESAIGGNVAIAIDVDDEARAASIFEKLAEDGSVIDAVRGNVLRAQVRHDERQIRRALDGQRRTRCNGAQLTAKRTYPPGVPCWVETLQPDPRAALAFYRALFEWDGIGPGPMPDGGEYFVAQARWRRCRGSCNAAGERNRRSGLDDVHVRR